MENELQGKYIAGDSRILASLSRPTITNRLKGEKEQLEKRLTDVNKAIELMEKNPEFQELLDALGKTYL